MTSVVSTTDAAPQNENYRRFSRPAVHLVFNLFKRHNVEHTRNNPRQRHTQQLIYQQKEQKTTATNLRHNRFEP